MTKVDQTINHVEMFLGDVMSVYIDDYGYEIGSDEYNEAHNDEIWVLSIDFVNDKGWDTSVAHEVVKQMKV